MNNLGNYIKKRRKELKLSQGQLSYKTQIPKSIIQRIETGDTKRTNPEYLKKLSIALEVNIIKLFELANYIYKEDINNYCSPFISEKIETQLELMDNSNTNLFPIYNSVSAGCGRIPEAEPDNYVSLPGNNLNCVGIKVKGDSMFPTISNDAIIFLKKDVEITNGDIGVFLLNDEAYVKRIVYSKDSTFLYSDNHSYLPILIKESDDFFVCGKVIKVLNNL